MLVVVVVVVVVVVTPNATLQAGYFWMCEVPRLSARNILTDSVTYFQFQILHLVCFYTVAEVKWFPVIDSKLLSKNNF